MDQLCTVVNKIQNYIDTLTTRLDRLEAKRNHDPRAWSPRDEFGWETKGPKDSWEELKVEVRKIFTPRPSHSYLENKFRRSTPTPSFSPSQPKTSLRAQTPPPQVNPNPITTTTQTIMATTPKPKTPHPTHLPLPTPIFPQPRPPLLPLPIPTQAHACSPSRVCHTLTITKPPTIDPPTPLAIEVATHTPTQVEKDAHPNPPSNIEEIQRPNNSHTSSLDPLETPNLTIDKSILQWLKKGLTIPSSQPCHLPMGYQSQIIPIQPHVTYQTSYCVEDLGDLVNYLHGQIHLTNMLAMRPSKANTISLAYPTTGSITSIYTNGQVTSEIILILPMEEDPILVHSPTIEIPSALIGPPISNLGPIIGEDESPLEDLESIEYLHQDNSYHDPFDPFQYPPTLLTTNLFLPQPTMFGQSYTMGTKTLGNTCLEIKKMPHPISTYLEPFDPFTWKIKGHPTTPHMEIIFEVGMLTSWHITPLGMISMLGLLVHTTHMSSRKHEWSLFGCNGPPLFVIGLARDRIIFRCPGPPTMSRELMHDRAKFGCPGPPIFTYLDRKHEQARSTFGCPGPPHLSDPIKHLMHDRSTFGCPGPPTTTIGSAFNLCKHINKSHEVYKSRMTHTCATKKSKRVIPGW